MSLVFAPIVAQVLTAGVGDRIEARVLVDSDDRRLEAENLASVTSALELEPLMLRATYAPSVLLTPLERSPRELSITHTLTGTADVTVEVYRSRTVTGGFHVGGAYVQQDLRRQRLGAPLPPTPAGADPDPAVPPTSPDRTSEGAVPAAGVTTRTVTGRADVAMSERASARNTFGQYVGYSVGTGVDETSRVLYPLIHGPDAGLSFIHLLSPRDTLLTEATGQWTYVPSTGERAMSLELTQGIVHLFSRQMSGDASVGAVYVRTEVPGEGRAHDVIPTALVGLSYTTRAAGGDLGLRLEVAYGPVLDRTNLVFDTRFDTLASLTWTKRRWTLYATAGTTIPVNVTEEGALRSIAGTAGADYLIGSGFSAHAGVRTAWETYQGVQVLPPTWVGFVALSWSAELL